jgi:hypothetical protein
MPPFIYGGKSWDDLSKFSFIHTLQKSSANDNVGIRINY